jgi:hypothetical protein
VRTKKMVTFGPLPACITPAGLHYPISRSLRFSADDDLQNVTDITKHISDTTRREPARNPC